MQSPLIVWEPTGNETLVVTTDVPDCSPVRLFDFWTLPELICQWWPQQASIEARVGGAYLLTWPAMDWRLRGHYTAFDPGHLLAFTWAWDHDSTDAPPKLVTIEFAATIAAEDAEDEDRTLDQPGTRLTLTHGSYLATPAEQELRIEHHLAGWRHFLPRLQQAASAQ